MIDFIKSLPKPILIVSCVIIYILIGMVVSFIAGLFDDGNEDFIVAGMFWIFILPLAALFGVLWLFVAPFRLGAKMSKPSKISNILHEEVSDESAEYIAHEEVSDESAEYIPYEEVSDELAEFLDKKYGFDGGVYCKDDPWWEETDK